MTLDVFAGVGAALAATAAIVVAVGVIARSSLIGKPLRWLWSKNVSEPVGDWHEAIVRKVVDTRIDHLMHNRNGGSSLLDLSESVIRAQTAIERIERKVSMSLQHDYERDQPGLRYGKDEPPETPEGE